MAPSEPDTGRLDAGALLTHYRIIEPLGAGGMGVVYRAVDERLNRQVALKVIRSGSSGLDARSRFLKEARAASGFSHPNIVTIHEVDTAGDVDFLVMELLPGQSLDKRVSAKPMSIDEVLAVAEPIAAALSAAHAADIVHRDIKPANVMLTESGHVKLLDFGIAKTLAGAAAPDAATLTVAEQTVAGAVLGSVAYMSPEQAQGRGVDGRSDVFSFGVLLYEMLSGRRPFGGTTAVETVAKILEATPPPLESLRHDVPDSLARLVFECLEKDRGRRPTATDVQRRLSETRQSRQGAGAGERSRRRALVALLVLAIVGGAGSVWWWESGRATREARRRVPELLAMADREDAYGFYHAAYPIVPLLPDDVLLQQAWNDLTFAIPQITSTPPGAQVLVKAYDAPDDAWISFGQTPIADPRFPRGTARMRVIKDGFIPYDGTPTFFALNAILDPAGSAPDGMLKVPGGTGTNEGRTFTVPAFWMDRHEVTNRQYKAFVDAGAYTNRTYWQEAIVDGGREMPWDAAIARFRDRTGRPGPATWELGTYPAGHADFPVSGISWYEAAAFAVYAGKSMPTAFQWRRAGDFNGPSGVYADLVQHSNFGSKGPVAVGSLPSIGPYGHYDMAGNVKEWCWNASPGGRMLLGGGWSEPRYMYEDRDAQPALARADTYGLRLVKNIDPQPPESLAFVPTRSRDYSVERPIDEQAFAVVKNLYAYDPSELHARLERTEDAPDWRREVVTFDAAYGNERVTAYVYVPKAARPPFQVVVYFPGADATMMPSSRSLNLTNVDFVIRSGRVLVWPVYKGTYERALVMTGPNALRDVTIQRSKDIRRTIDYVAARADFDAARIAYYGVSLGAFNGILTTAMEPRLKANVLLGGGLALRPAAAEIDSLNFAPRIRVPTLMVNGDSDYQNPLQTSQLPLFRALTLPPDQKRHALFSGGHMPSQIHDIIREILDWYDRFLGPVAAMAQR